MKPRKGMYAQAARWFDADKPGQREIALKLIKGYLYEFAVVTSVILGPLEIEEVDPLSPRVPSPPKRFQGNIKCLIGSAPVIEEVCQVVENRLTEELPEEQLHQMRAATRRAWKRAGGATELTDEEADLWINREGPEAAIPETMH